MVKEVKVVDTLLDKYSDKELVHFIARELRAVSTSMGSLEDTEWSQIRYGYNAEEIENISSLMTALDKRMNKDISSPRVMI